MLSGFEALLVAAVADLLADRPGLAVVEAGGEPPAPPASQGVLEIGLSAATPDQGQAFSPGDRLPPLTAVSVRVVALRAEVVATVIRRAAAISSAALINARRAALEDMTLLLHALDDPLVRSGAALRSSAPDPGFRVEEVSLGTVAVEPAAGDLVRATATYTFRLLVWPPGTTVTGAVIEAVDALVAAQPLSVSVVPAVLDSGAAATISISGVSGSRLVNRATGTRAALQLAVGVRSELPPADRGVVSGGTASSVSGFRVLPVTEPQTVVTYTAPAGPLGGVRTEEVVIHLAVTTDGADPGVGARLGSVTVALRAGV